jgi:PBP1b-binding outer membrane lipoprotein LpoB
MKLRSIMTVSLLTVILLVSCAPAAAPAPVEPEAPAAQPAAPQVDEPAPPPATPAVAQPEPAPVEAMPTEAPAEVPQAVATSRGPDLEATDPATVSLASGDLHFVEFFRFT